MFAWFACFFGVLLLGIFLLSACFVCFGCWGWVFLSFYLMWVFLALARLACWFVVLVCVLFWCFGCCFVC